MVSSTLVEGYKKPRVSRLTPRTLLLPHPKLATKSFLNFTCLILPGKALRQFRSDNNRVTNFGTLRITLTSFVGPKAGWGVFFYGDIPSPSHNLHYPDRQDCSFLKTNILPVSIWGLSRVPEEYGLEIIQPL